MDSSHSCFVLIKRTWKTLKGDEQVVELQNSNRLTLTHKQAKRSRKENQVQYFTGKNGFSWQWKKDVFSNKACRFNEKVV